MMMIIISVVVADLRIKNCWGQAGPVGPSTKTGNRNLMIPENPLGSMALMSISQVPEEGYCTCSSEGWTLDTFKRFWEEKYVGLDFRPIVTLSTENRYKTKITLKDLTVNWTIMGYGPYCVFVQEETFTANCMSYCLIIHSTIHLKTSNNFTHAVRLWPWISSGTPKKKSVCRRHFYVSCFCSLESWLLCKLFCNVRKLILFLRNIPSWILLPKKTSHFQVLSVIAVSQMCNYTPLSCLLPAHPLLHFQAVHSCVMTDLDFKDFFYKYILNIPSVTLIPVWSGKCWKVKYLLRILCQVLPKCRPSRCQAFLAQEACNQVFWTKK